VTLKIFCVPNFFSLLAAERFVWEERVDEAEELDGGDWFARAFNETSWHFLEVEDDVDLATTMTAGAGASASARSFLGKVRVLDAVTATSTSRATAPPPRAPASSECRGSLVITKD
jgi:hypothetical protein